MQQSAAATFLCSTAEQELGVTSEQTQLAKRSRVQLAGRCWVILVELFNNRSKALCQDSKVKPGEKGMLTWHTGKVTTNQKMLMKKTG